MRRCSEESSRTGAGFTLLEVMIAMTLLAIGVLSLAAMQLLVMQYGSRGRHLTEASAIAQSQMERLQRTNWQTDPLIQPTGGAWSGPTPIPAVIQDPDGSVTHQAFDLYVRVQDAVPGVTRRVDVRVDWDEPKRPGRSYALSSLRYNTEGL